MLKGLPQPARDGQWPRPGLYRALLLAALCSYKGAVARTEGGSNGNVSKTGGGGKGGASDPRSIPFVRLFVHLFGFSFCPGSSQNFHLKLETTPAKCGRGASEQEGKQGKKGRHCWHHATRGCHLLARDTPSSAAGSVNALGARLEPAAPATVWTPADAGARRKEKKETSQESMEEPRYAEERLCARMLIVAAAIGARALQQVCVQPVRSDSDYPPREKTDLVSRVDRACARSWGSIRGCIA